MPLNNPLQDAPSSSLYFCVFPPRVAWCNASARRDATVLEILGKALPFALGRNGVGSKTDSAVYKLAAFLNELQEKQFNVCGSAYPSKCRGVRDCWPVIMGGALEKECLEYLPKCGPLFSSCSQLVCSSQAGSPSFWLLLVRWWV